MRVKEVDLVWGTSPPIFQGLTAWAHCPPQAPAFPLRSARSLAGFCHRRGCTAPTAAHQGIGMAGAHLIPACRPAPGQLTGFYRPCKAARGASQVELLPNGADPAMFDPSASGDDFRHVHHLEGKFVVLYAGAHGMSNDLSICCRLQPCCPKPPRCHCAPGGW